MGKIILNGNRVNYGKNIVIKGIPIIDVHRTATCIIGNNCTINSGNNFNPIGRNQPSFIIIRNNAKLIIGDNVGLSSTAIIAQNSIILGSNIKIGGNTVIYDSDFHSLNFEDRRNKKSDIPKAVPVFIDDDVFIGSHVTILKGVTIGKGAIIASCSVVTKDIPKMEIWGGNPAKFIRTIPQ